MLDRTFIKSVTTALSGGVVAQLVVLLASPVITRIYPPDIYGAFASLNAYASLLAPLLILSYSIILVLPNRKKDSFYILISAIIMSTLLSVVLFILYVFFSNYLNFGGSIIFLAWTVSIMQLYSYWFIREEKFSFRAKYLILQAIMVAILKVTIGYVYPNIDGLILSTLIPGFLFSLLIGVHIVSVHREGLDNGEK
ncbi:lipopolysaccharide biosynthesis protein [Vibrio hibernica]|uniref:lipopolysaccharide biosynthesis protein n=1 Tax=Vibrio hibernica TaxID=2587465 RepID=UPI001882FA9B|nr:hypothetical protein [Vibrio hibernica]